VALLAVLAVSVVIGQVEAQVHIANVSMLYLLAVLGTAIRFGRGPAIAASIAAFLVFDWFFLEPLHNWTVTDPQELLALLLLLAAGTVTGQLAADQRRRAHEARDSARESALLYQLARILAEADLGRGLDAALELLRTGVGLGAVVVRSQDERGQVASTASAGATDLVALANAAGREVRVLDDTSRADMRWVRVVPPRPTDAAPPSVHVVPLIAHEQRVGTLALVPSAMSGGLRASDAPLLAAAAALIGAAIERSHLRRIATETEVLQRADELKSAVLGAVSHDLRTPLASILASASSLRQKDVTWSEAERADFLADIESETRRLTRIVTNLLDLSRLEAGSLHPERAWYDLGALVDDVAGRLGDRAPGGVSVRLPDDLPAVLLDYVEIEQVLSNLVENAIRHGGTAPRIEIVVTRHDDTVSVEVADRGPGIPGDALGRIFEPFYPVAGRTRGGIGLGLAVARGLVRAHGGSVWARRRDGGGSIVGFDLPLQGEAAPDGVAPAR